MFVSATTSVSFHDECIGHPARSQSAALEAVGDLLRAAFGSMEDNRVAIMILQNERQYLHHAVRIRLPRAAANGPLTRCG